jgi:hypothetical protein
LVVSGWGLMSMHTMRSIPATWTSASIKAEPTYPAAPVISSFILVDFQLHYVDGCDYRLQDALRATPICISYWKF